MGNPSSFLTPKKQFRNMPSFQLFQEPSQTGQSRHHALHFLTALHLPSLLKLSTLSNGRPDLCGNCTRRVWLRSFAEVSSWFTVIIACHILLPSPDLGLSLKSRQSETALIRMASSYKTTFNCVHHKPWLWVITASGVVKKAFSLTAHWKYSEELSLDILVLKQFIDTVINIISY